MSVIRLTTANLEHFSRRIATLKSDSPRKWGSMSPAKMLAHLRLTLELSCGDRPVPDNSSWFSRKIYKYLVYHVFPWPKGRIKVPDQFSPEPEFSFDEERTKMLAAAQRFAETSAKEPTRSTVHFMFGPMTLEYWQHVHGRHFDHHLKQFGA